jgi:hypothetical protein
MTRMTVTEKTARSVTEFMDDPISFFGQSYTQMHSISRSELEALQRQAMDIRFQQHRESIEMLRKLADRLGITALHEFNDVVPLFFSHTAFKSYRHRRREPRRVRQRPSHLRAQRNRRRRSGEG